MFKFLKDKLKSALDTFTKKVDEKSEILKEESKEEIALKKEAAKEEIKEEIPAKEEVKVVEEKKEGIKPETETKKEEAKEKDETTAEDFKEVLKEEAVEAAEETFIATAETEIEKEEKKGKTEQELFSEQLKKVEEEHGLDVYEEPIKAKKDSGIFSKIKRIFGKKEKERVEEKREEKKGITEIIAEKITKKVLSEKQFDEIFNDLEIAMLENNVAVEVVEKIKGDMKKVIVNRPIPRNKINETVAVTLKTSIGQLFDSEKVDLLNKVKSKKPFIILFFGVNGSGKTTTIAKMAKMLQESGLKCVIAAADTFRAAAIQQLEEHANKISIPLIKKDYGADPAAVAFDAIKFAESQKMDVLLIDTAGRLHSNVNLMDEMRKMVRVAKPDMKIFIGESTTGNDCVEQAKRFNEALGIDAIILSKADVDEKGGAAISVSYITKKPIIYIGTGQGYADLKPFNPEIIVEGLGL